MYFCIKHPLTKSIFRYILAFYQTVLQVVIFYEDSSTILSDAMKREKRFKNTSNSLPIQGILNCVRMTFENIFIVFMP